MKRVLALVLTALLLVSAISVVSAAAKVDSRKTCEAYIASVTVDGKIDDVWAYAPAYEVTNVKTYEKNTYYKDTMKTGVDYAQETCKVLWDGSNTLYVLAIVKDTTPHYEADSGSSWQNDGVEIFWSFENSATNKSATKVQTRFYNDDQCVLASDKVKAHKAAKTSDGWVLEVAIDVSSAGGAGQYLGIDFQYNDSVLGNTRQVCLGWSDTTDKASSDPTVYGQCLLSSTKVADLKKAAEEKAAAEKAAAKVTMDIAAAPKTADAGIVLALVALAAASTAIVIKKKH